MTEAQFAAPFPEPPRDKIPRVSRRHVAAMEASNHEAVWMVAHMRCVVLITMGRRTGREHKVALPYWLDPAGRPIVVASFSGAPVHPAWYLNGTDKTANPGVRVRDQGRAFWASFDVLDGDDRDRTWASLTSDRPWYLGYQHRCERRIPLVRLTERAPE